MQSYGYTEIYLKLCVNEANRVRRTKNEYYKSIIYKHKSDVVVLVYFNWKLFRTNLHVTAELFYNCTLQQLGVTAIQTQFNERHLQIQGTFNSMPIRCPRSDIR